ncbi:MAG: CcmD family protein [Bacteroidota bacterium]|nr:CcmD family protein [Bacteroidota bacterium]
MKSNGKIFVVMAVVIVIVLGLFIYLFALDRQIRRIEKK